MKINYDLYFVNIVFEFTKTITMVVFTSGSHLLNPTPRKNRDETSSFVPTMLPIVLERIRYRT